jgi:hypothetical protein
MMFYQCVSAPGVGATATACEGGRPVLEATPNLVARDRASPLHSNSHWLPEKPITTTTAVQEDFSGQAASVMWQPLGPLTISWTISLLFHQVGVSGRLLNSLFAWRVVQDVDGNSTVLGY